MVESTGFVFNRQTKTAKVRRTKFSRPGLRSTTPGASEEGTPGTTPAVETTGVAACPDLPAAAEWPSKCLAAAPELVDFRSVAAALVHETAGAGAALQNKRIMSRKNKEKETGTNSAESYPTHAPRGRPNLPSLALLGGGAGATAEGEGPAKGAAEGTTSPNAA